MKITGLEVSESRKEIMNKQRKAIYKGRNEVWGAKRLIQRERSSPGFWLSIPCLRGHNSASFPPLDASDFDSCVLALNPLFLKWAL